MTEQELKARFAHTLQDHLDRQHWTQQDLADRLSRDYGLHVGRNTISYWVNGKQMPRLIVIVWIAECFGEDPSTFLPLP